MTTPRTLPADWIAAAHAEIDALERDQAKDPKDFLANGRADMSGRLDALAALKVRLDRIHQTSSHHKEHRQ